jgi:hypothetical protein
VRHGTRFLLTQPEANAKYVLDLGRVVATAEVHVNGKKVGVRVAPPWRVDVTGSLKRGENQVEVLVYNTRANHYQISPASYCGKPNSGLMGPVRLLSREGGFCGQAQLFAVARRWKKLTRATDAATASGIHASKVGRQRGYPLSVLQPRPR